jgi:hypothetical protein
MEYCPGGELYSYIVKHKRFTLEISKFIASEVILGIYIYIYVFFLCFLNFFAKYTCLVFFYN